MHEQFIVIEIGCLECMMPSSLVGKFFTEIEANNFAYELEKKHNGSDVAYVVFDLNVIESPTND